MTKKQTLKPLIIIDGFSFIFRAYYVQPPLISPSGYPVGAIYGFTSMLLKLIKDFKPEHAVIVLDHSDKNFRHNLYTDYKANRPVVPNDLIMQLKILKKVAKALNFQYVSKAGYEADDIIATLANQAISFEREIIIISSDKDLMQLINHHIKMFDPVKYKFILEEDVINKFGVVPNKVREVQALMGDRSDNIPGVKGIGPKTAATLIQQFGDVNTILSSIQDIQNKHQQKLLQHSVDSLKLSWQLVGLDSNIDLDIDINALQWEAPTAEHITQFLLQYGFQSLITRIQNLFNLDIPHAKRQTNNTLSPDNGPSITTHTILSIQDFTKFKNVVNHHGIISVFITQYNTHSVEITFYVNNTLYIAPYIGSISSYQETKGIVSSDKVNKHINLDNQINTLFADKSIKKIVFNLKNLLKICNCVCNSFEDLQLMDYILHTGQKNRTMGNILDDCNIQKNLTRSQTESEAIYAIHCYQQLHSKLFANKLLYFYQDVDLPMCYILHEMETEGIKIDIRYLDELSQEFTSKIEQLKHKICAVVGKDCNIASPKQLGDILFGKMNLPFAKIKGTTQSFSTSVDVLEKLHKEGFEIARWILEWRHFTKLKNTYTDILPIQAEPNTHRVHTTFSQVKTTTSRLSSYNPNVQNIPTKTIEGSKVRAAFIASKGKLLISADYSQIELRILSHVAHIKPLQKAISENRDIHVQTASQIFNLAITKVDAESRRKAKAINFGIIYGISSFGLAKQLNISKNEAFQYINKYFEQYSGIKQYMYSTIEFAKSHGYVTNLLGRKCFIPEIHHKNHTIRSFAERASINAPIQSLASDIIKIAMININTELKKNCLQTKILLQIHDELIFEAPNEELQNVIPLIKNTMESAITLEVKTDVKIRSGNNWRDMH